MSMNELLLPLGQVAAIGGAVALGPLIWWRQRSRDSSSAGRLRALTLLALFLTFDLIVFGAFTRLTDSGLGCPDWPGCYSAASPVGADPALDAARGRFARNAIIQGAAAELFKAWAATVRATTRDLGAQVVLCLHDELLVHAPAEHAAEVAARVDRALYDAARRWAGGAPVRFVADTSVIARWSDAKD